MTNETKTYDVVIVGAGPAGMCAALYAGRSLLSTVVLERGIPGGELLNTEYLDDVLGFPRILGRDLAKLYADHAKQFGAEFHEGINVERVTKLEDGSFETTTSQGVVYRSKVAIVTAGGTPNKLGVPGEQEYAGQGVSYCAICDGAFFKGMCWRWREAEMPPPRRPITSRASPRRCTSSTGVTRCGPLRSCSSVCSRTRRSRSSMTR